MTFVIAHHFFCLVSSLNYYSQEQQQQEQQQDNMRNELRDIASKRENEEGDEGRRRREKRQLFRHRPGIFSIFNHQNRPTASSSQPLQSRIPRTTRSTSRSTPILSPPRKKENISQTERSGHEEEYGRKQRRSGIISFRTFSIPFPSFSLSKHQINRSNSSTSTTNKKEDRPLPPSTDPSTENIHEPKHQRTYQRQDQSHGRLSFRQASRYSSNMNNEEVEGKSNNFIRRRTSKTPLRNLSCTGSRENSRNSLSAMWAAFGPKSQSNLQHVNTQEQYHEQQSEHGTSERIGSSRFLTDTSKIRVEDHSDEGGEGNEEDVSTGSFIMMSDVPWSNPTRPTRSNTINTSPLTATRGERESEFEAEMEEDEIQIDTKGENERIKNHLVINNSDVLKVSTDGEDQNKQVVEDRTRRRHRQRVQELPQHRRIVSDESNIQPEQSRQLPTPSSPNSRLKRTNTESTINHTTISTTSVTATSRSNHNTICNINNRRDHNENISGQNATHYLHHQRLNSTLPGEGSHAIIGCEDDTEEEEEENINNNNNNMEEKEKASSKLRKHKRINTDAALVSTKSPVENIPSFTRRPSTKFPKPPQSPSPRTPTRRVHSEIGTIQSSSPLTGSSSTATTDSPIKKGDNSDASNVWMTAMYYMRLADLGDAQAQCDLGTHFERGLGVERDMKQALYLYGLSSRQGHPRAQFHLARCYAHGLGTPVDWYKAFHLYRQAAHSGHVPSICNLGVCYHNGTGTAPDHPRAVSLYREAALSDYPRAWYNLGVCYESGVGVTRDLVRAAALYKKAAQGRFAQGACSLGSCYEHGVGVYKDLNKAVGLYRKAASAGCARAMFYLGLCYEGGRGINQSMEEAVSLYKRAARLGSHDAVLYLHRFHSHLHKFNILPEMEGAAHGRV